MDIKSAVDSMSLPVNAGGAFYLAFPYTSCVGKEAEQLTVQVPMKREQPSEGDKKALLEAVILQGGIGKWTTGDDGTVWLVPVA